MNYENILVNKEAGIATITINRIDKMNALNIATLQEIKSAILDANQAKDVHVIILTGVGQKAFAAGADIAEFVNFSEDEGRQMAEDGHLVMDTIERSAKPVIAAVNGFTLGGGCELAMACHIRIASENARFGQPEINLGLVPGYGGTQRLCEIVGKGRALNMLLSGDAIKADEALRIGLVSQVVPIDELITSSVKLANKLIGKSPYALSKVIELVNSHYSPSKPSYAMEAKEFGAAFQKPDFKEGTEAFLSKREASFHNR